jgi:hypothetical protein
MVMLAASLAVVLGGTLATAAPSRDTTAAGPTPTPTVGAPLPIPTGPATPVACFPGSLQPECRTPATTASPPASTSVPSCTGQGCPPHPTTSTPAPSNPDIGQPTGTDSSGDADCGITNINGCVTNAINSFFRSAVTSALNPLLDLLSTTLLTTPTPDSLPRIAELWNSSWHILLASYALLILLAGILVMSYETLQTRYGIKEIALRIVVGFLAGAVSMWTATHAIELANALAHAVMGGGLDANTAGETLRNLVLGALNGGIFVVFIGVFLAAMLVVLLVSYVVRVMLTITLIAGAPIALMCHALPQTEHIAYWWWKAFGGCLAIQVVQSLTLITAMRVFLAPGGFTLIAPTESGLVNLLVALALVYILVKIPFWCLGSLRGGGGRSLLSSLVRGFIAYKTFGLLRGRGGGHQAPRRSGDRRGANGGDSEPYARTRTTRDGQYMLPLSGVRRTRSTATPKPTRTPKPRGAQGRQLPLPLGDDWPEWKQHDASGQYRLPLDVQRVKPTAPPPGRQRTPSVRPQGRPRGGQQMQLPFDPYQGNRPDRSGQYPLPLEGLRRTPRLASPPPATPRPRKRRVTQPELPFDPYQGNRTTRSGQYPLPLEGLRKVAPRKPAPAPPVPATRPTARPGRQLRLPLDLPKPPRRTPPPPPKPGGKS